MKKVLSGTVIFLFLLLYSGMISAAATHENVIITFHETVDEEFLQENLIHINQTFSVIPAVSAMVTKDQRAKLKEHPNIKWVETDEVIQVQNQTTNDGYDLVQAHEAKAAGWTGKGVKVAIIDTGINGKHRDLRVSGGISFIQDSPYDEDLFGHGTHVAGIIGALDNSIGVLGVAPDAQLFSVKALDNHGFGSQGDLIAAIEWTIENKMDIVNLSLTTPKGTRAMEAALQMAYDKGILIVAAAGNMEEIDEEIEDVLYPARYPSVIAVCSVQNDLSLSPFSYYGPSLEICAQGFNINSTYSNGEAKEYEIKSGTSVAAPFVTGVLALYKQAYPTMSHQQIRKLMQTNSLLLGENEKFGYGLVQAPTNELTTYSDVKANSWYTKEINFLSAASIVTGFPDMTFRAEDMVTRADAVIMIARALRLEENHEGTSFSDVKAGMYAEGYIEEAVKKEIINGYPDGTFRPYEKISRGDAAVIIQRAFSYIGGKDRTFTDVKNTDYYFDAINALKEANITNGYPDKTFRPKEPITRGELSVFIARTLNDEFK